MIEKVDIEDITASENNTIFFLSSVFPSLFQNFHKAINSSVLGLSLSTCYLPKNDGNTKGWHTPIEKLFSGTWRELEMIGKGFWAGQSVYT